MTNATFPVNDAVPSVVPKVAASKANSAERSSTVAGSRTKPAAAAPGIVTSISAGNAEELSNPTEVV